MTTDQAESSLAEWNSLSANGERDQFATLAAIGSPPEYFQNAPTGPPTATPTRSPAAHKRGTDLPSKSWQSQKNASFGLAGLLSSAAVAPKIPASIHFIEQGGGAACLDGSAPAFWLMPGVGEGATKMYVHMEGGGWCTSLVDCAHRAGSYLGSSTGLGATDLQGLVDDWGAWYVSNSSAINPLMASWTKVVVHYCDGASWAGDNATRTVVGGRELHFAGRRNVDGLLAALRANHSLRRVTDLVVSGGSAGGLAAYLHADAFAAAAPPTAKVVAMPDAGFFLRNGDSEASGWERAMRWAFSAQNASAGVPRTCAAHFAPSGEVWRCFFAQYVAPFVATPIFALQSMYDKYQLPNMLKSNDPRRVDAYGANLTATLVQALSLGPDTPAASRKNGAFLDACYHHAGAWPRLQIQKTTAWDAMAAWYSGLGTNRTAAPVPRFLQQVAPDGFPCNDCCPKPCGCRSCC